MKIKLDQTFNDIADTENLLEAWREFVRGKRNRRDVQEFSLRLMDNILDLHHDLLQRTYKHGSYQAFKIRDSNRKLYAIHFCAILSIAQNVLTFATSTTLCYYFQHEIISGPS